MIITKTPFRISFFGGGTDLPTFSKKYGGAVIGSSINKYIYHNISKLPSNLFDYSVRFPCTAGEGISQAIIHRIRPPA